MEISKRPHMVVGVDLGTTSYPTGSLTPSSWDFLLETAAETGAEDKEYKEWFKTCLDPDKLRRKQIEDPEGALANFQEVERWYSDYLSKMYEYLVYKLGGELAGTSWKNARIEFIFSVPTTWAPAPTVDNFRRIAKQAGFGSCSSHTLAVGLTEAEAATVHVSVEASGIFRENDLLLVCDAGGDTTDLSVLKVTGTINQAIDLHQLDVVFGATIGSAAIGYEFEQLVTQRLKRAHVARPLPTDPADAAWEIMKSPDFQAVKCEYGAPDDTPIFSLAILQVHQTYQNSDPAIRIRNGEMTFDRQDLQKLFDRQTQKLFKLIDQQSQPLFQKVPAENVSHFVLSGGPGNNAYVQSQLQFYYGQGSIPNARSLAVHIAPDPQLTVRKGLVSDRIRKTITSKSVLGWRCCRASYGTMCKLLFDIMNPAHRGKTLIRDEINGKMYVTDSIAWFVKKGEPVSVNTPIEHNFIKKLEPGDPRRAFPTTVIESNLDESLPDQIDQDLSQADEKKFVEKNCHFWSLQKHYIRIGYTTRVLVGPAGIRFELWFDDQKLSRDESIHVEWMPAQPPTGSNWARPAGAQVIEMSTMPPTPIHLPDNPFNGIPNGKGARTKVAIVASEDTMKSRIEGLLARSRGGRQSPR